LILIFWFEITPAFSAFLCAVLPTLWTSMFVAVDTVDGYSVA
jgi:hypothetical protein